MSKIKFVISSSVYKENDMQVYESLFNGFCFDWLLFGEQLHFSTEVIFKKKLDPFYNARISSIKDMLEILPDDESLKEELKVSKSEKEKYYYWTIDIVFFTETEVFIDYKDNFFEDDYEDYVKKCILGIVMSIVLSKPELDIHGAYVKTFIDNKLYKGEFFIGVPLQNDAAKKFPKLIETKLTLEKTMSWIKLHTSLHDETITTPTAFLALTYVLNREHSESLLYSTIGLESIYTPGSKGISQLLQKRIAHIFPSVTKQAIKNIYDMRSKFVHGELELSHYHLLMEKADKIPILKETEYLATALLLESIRLLIYNDSENIKFSETISYNFL